MQIFHVMRATAYRLQVSCLFLSTLSIVYQKRVGLGWGSWVMVGKYVSTERAGCYVRDLQRLHFSWAALMKVCCNNHTDELRVVYSEIHPAIKRDTLIPGTTAILLHVVRIPSLPTDGTNKA